MKISNFKKIAGGHATVDVTTGFLWFSKTVTRHVALSYGLYWFFVDTGEFTPSCRVEELARSSEAKERLGL